MSDLHDANGALDVPQDEHALVAMLHPDNPMLFAHARRWLAQSLPAGAARFLVGRVAPGCWSVLRGADGWPAVDGGPGETAETTVFGDARSAVVHVLAEIMAAEGMGINSEVLRTAGLVRWSKRKSPKEPIFWELTEAGQELWERSCDAPRPAQGGGGRRSYLSLEPLQRHPLGYFVCVPGPPPAKGPFVSTHEVFALLAETLLPGPLNLDVDGVGDDGSMTLPEGAEVDCYGGTGQVMVYAPNTVLHRRGHQNSPPFHILRRYRVCRPLRVYPGFWFETTTIRSYEEITDPPQDDGIGYYLVDSIADLLRSGGLEEIAPLGEVRWRTR